MTGSRHAEDANAARARERAEAATGEDRYGLRSEFVTHIDTYLRIAD